MFTVYKNGIIDFRSTTENLYNVKSTGESKLSHFETKEGLVKDFQGQGNAKKENNNYLNSYEKISKIDANHVTYYVKDIMTQDMIYIDNSHTVRELYNLLDDKKIAQIPVTSIDKKIIGLVDSKFILDLFVQNLSNAHNIFNKKLRDISFPDIITTHPNTDLKEVIKLMLDLRLGALAVVNDEGELKGIVSKSYIFKAMSRIPQLEIWS